MAQKKNEKMSMRTIKEIKKYMSKKKSGIESFLYICK